MRNRMIRIASTLTAAGVMALSMAVLVAQAPSGKAQAPSGAKAPNKERPPPLRHDSNLDPSMNLDI